MTSLYVWGNQHCSDKNGFRDAFCQLVARHTLFPCPSYHVDHLLNDDVIDKLSLNLTHNQAVLVVVFGDSNLANAESILQILGHFQSIFQLFQHHRNFQIIVCGPIPPRTPTPFQLTKITSLNCHLQQLAESFDRIEFIPLNDCFGNDDYADYTYLNFQGSVKFAKILVRALIRYSFD